VAARAGWRTLLGPPEDRPGVLVTGACLLLLAVAGLLASADWATRGPTGWLGLLLLSAFVLAVFAIYVRKLQPREAQTPKNLLILCIVFLTVLILARLFLLLADSVALAVPSAPRTSLEYLMPIALGGILLQVLFNTRLGFAGSLVLSILTSLLAGGELRFFFFALVGGIVGVFAIGERQERAGFFRAGAWIGLANAYTLLGVSLFEGQPGRLGADLLAALANGFVVALLAAGLLPLFESLFGVTTNFGLLELANLQQPLLRDLVLRAPGTYHHSVMVGMLAEAAAEAIGANALLCRVAAYYHDIGKLRQPGYFVENQPEAGSRHDRLSPNLSSLIIISHVKEGMELARQHRLPPPIIEMIPQHHGTGLVTFFYHKAREAADPQHGEVQQEEFRYPGPKPQTKEAAIMMLADAVEAASRTVAEPAPAKIQGLVERIIQTVFADGQLEECDLTLRDLHRIADSFTRTLAGIFHHRVDYPGGPVAELARRGHGNGHSGPKPAPHDPDRRAEAEPARPDRP
jgi:putative nucleotidyltransferase with HDIG domain